MILDLHRQGLSVSDIARRTGFDRKTVRRYIARGLEPPAYKPRPLRPGLLDPYRAYLRERVAAFPELRASRLLRELRGMGYRGGYTQLTAYLRQARPPVTAGFEERFETPPGQQAQVDFAHFRTAFTTEPGITRVVWLFSLVLGHSRLMWGRFVTHQDLQAVLRCHVAAFEALGGVPSEILYDRMRTAVSGEDEAGVSYNPTLLACARHYGFQPQACRPYRAKSKGKVERSFRYVREDFFLARSFCDLDDLNAQFRQWLDEVANARAHATTRRVVSEHFAAERPHLKPLPAGPFQAVLKLERRTTRDGIISVGGNLYSVPDATGRRTVEVHTLAHEVGVGAGRPGDGWNCRSYLGLMPSKHHAARRHRTPKARYRVRNWRAYEAGLQGRGDLTLWVDEAALAGWRAPRRSTPDGQPRYADLAIEAVLSLRLVFRLALRQAAGLAASVLRLLGLDLPVPDHTTLSRRGRAFAGRQSRVRVGNGPMHLVLDSTGLKLFGQGEWDAAKHGRKKRQWLKLHLAVDAGTGEIAAHVLTGRARPMTRDKCRTCCAQSRAPSPA